ncbi:hypothetical protein ACLBV5_09815 [Brevundimonas sp. M1A4_2e]
MILNAIRKLITGIDPVELNARLANIENGGAYAREVAHGVQAEVVHARGGQESLLDALASKATRADVAQLHTRADLTEADILGLRSELIELAKPPVSPLEAPGTTRINGRLIDADGKLVTDLPAKKTGEPNLGSMVWDNGTLTVTSPKVTKARKPRAPKGGGK